MHLPTAGYGLLCIALLLAVAYGANAWRKWRSTRYLRRQLRLEQGMEMEAGRWRRPPLYYSFRARPCAWERRQRSTPPEYCAPPPLSTMETAAGPFDRPLPRRETRVSVGEVEERSPRAGRLKDQSSLISVVGGEA